MLRPNLEIWTIPDSSIPHLSTNLSLYLVNFLALSIFKGSKSIEVIPGLLIIINSSAKDFDGNQIMDRKLMWI